MAEAIEMPELGDTMEAGKIVAWHKKVGEKVSAGELLAEIQTDKATVDLEFYFDGILLYIGVEEGEEVAIGTLIVIIGNEGEDITPPKFSSISCPKVRAMKEKHKRTRIIFILYEFDSKLGRLS